MSAALWMQALVWGGVVLVAVTGVIPSKTHGLVRRRETPRRFWYGWAVLFVVAAFFSFFLNMRRVFDLLGIG